MTAHSVTADSASHGEIPHASAGKYVQIATMLFLLTAAEVLLYETCFGHLREGAGSFATFLAPHFVETLLFLSAIKFWLVAMFYMHLKFDLKVLSWLFGFSLLIAFVVVMALFTLFTYNRTLWWIGGKW